MDRGCNQRMSKLGTDFTDVYSMLKLQSALSKRSQSKKTQSNDLIAVKATEEASQMPIGQGLSGARIDTCEQIGV